MNKRNEFTKKREIISNDINLENNPILLIIFFLKGFKNGWKFLSDSLSIILNFFLLFITYIVSVGFVFIIANLFRKKFFMSNFKSKLFLKNKQFGFKKESYWKLSEQPSNSDESYYRMF
jgi:hypothetical protein